MKISVCMATHNGERYLHEQLASILSQLGEGDEVIISDDSSADGTVDIIRGFGDQRIHLLTGNTFFNPMHNLENALKHASGDIIALSDQDDVWLGNKVRIIRERFEVQGTRSKVQGKTRFTAHGLPGHSRKATAGSPISDNGSRFTVHHPLLITYGIRLLSLDGRIIDGEGKIFADSIFEQNRAGRGLLKNLYDNKYMGCTMAFTRELLDLALPFPPGIPMHDSWLGLLAELHGEVEFVRERTMMYRRHGSNVSRRLPFKRQVGGRVALAWNLWKRRKGRGQNL